MISWRERLYQCGTFNRSDNLSLAYRIERSGLIKTNASGRVLASIPLGRSFSHLWSESFCHFLLTLWRGSFVCLEPSAFFPRVLSLSLKDIMKSFVFIEPRCSEAFIDFDILIRRTLNFNYSKVIVLIFLAFLLSGTLVFVCSTLLSSSLTHSSRYLEVYEQNLLQFSGSI